MFKSRQFCFVMRNSPSLMYWKIPYNDSDFLCSKFSKIILSVILYADQSIFRQIWLKCIVKNKCRLYHVLRSKNMFRLNQFHHFRLKSAAEISHSATHPTTGSLVLSWRTAYKFYGEEHALDPACHPVLFCWCVIFIVKEINSERDCIPLWHHFSFLLTYSSWACANKHRPKHSVRTLLTYDLYEAENQRRDF
jgi:hypothetical protein